MNPFDIAPHPEFLGRWNVVEYDRDGEHIVLENLTLAKAQTSRDRLNHDFSAEMRAAHRAMIENFR